MGRKRESLAGSKAVPRLGWTCWRGRSCKDLSLLASRLPLFSPQDDQTQTSETRAKAQGEHHDEPPEKPEGLIQELEVLLLDQRFVLGLRGNIEAGAVDSQGLQGDVFSQRWSQLGSGCGRRILGDGDVC